MITIDTLTSDWTALSPAAQRALWRHFIEALDAGAAGYHRYYQVLMPLWDRGDVPDWINSAALTEATDEVRGAASSDLLQPSPINRWRGHLVCQLDGATAGVDPAELPF